MALKMMVPSAILTGALLLLYVGDSNQLDSVFQFGLNDASFKTGKTGYLSVMLNKTVTEDGQWYKDGTLLSRIPSKLLLLSYVDQGVRQMVLYNIQLRDAGQYTFTVRGESTSANLTVTGSGIMDGGWSEWTQWVTNNDCPATCGTTATATKTRNRRCDNPSPQNGGRDCTGSPAQTLQTQCGSQDCPTDGQGTVNGGWSNWGSWSSSVCSVTCGTTSVLKTRNRTCTNPRPQNGGADCQGSSTEYMTDNCVRPRCAIDGGWSPWGQWGNRVCPQTCGSSVIGNRTRSRYCNNPYPQYGGATCNEPQTETATVECALSACPASVFLLGLQDITQPEGSQVVFRVILAQTGNTGIWYKDGYEVTGSDRVYATGEGNVQILFINNLQSSDAGLYTLTISGETTNAHLTVTGQGTVNGGWSNWGSWSSSVCSVTCGTTSVLKTRNRTCSNPRPQNGGADCQGSSTEYMTDSCVRPRCPIDGGWSPWGQWGNRVCPQTCGSSVIGNRTRSRYCNNPYPQYGGATCIGPQTETATVECALSACPASVFLLGLQDITQPEGSQVVFRVILAQTGNTGIWYKDGYEVTGSDRVYATGEGNVQILFINNLQSSDAGLYTLTISGETTNAHLTVTGQGTVNGGWSNWGSWSSSVCSVTCGTTSILKTRNRTCSNPRPQNGGADCQGSSTEYMTDSCVRPRCPIDGGWSPWGQWGNRVCPQTCGSSVIGKRTRSRLCNNPYPQYGGATCVGPRTETATAECALSACPASVFLRGLQDITKPGGSQVVFRVILTQTGNTGIWYKDGYEITGSDRVYATGGGNLQILFIKNLQSSDAGLYTFTISGETTNAHLTVTGQGTVHGGWSNWSSWSSSVCSVTCGTTSGLKTRNRTCSNPRPQNGGADCQGSSTEYMTDRCVRPRCPIDGGWSPWGQWGNRDCPQTCGSSFIGNRTRSRYCNNPYPQYGGATCVGPRTETATVECALSACPDPASGTWSNWSSWSRSTCTVTCGSRDIQTLTRNRTCVTNGGSGQCVGGNVQTDFTACGPLVCPTIIPPTSRSHKSQQYSSLLISGCLTIAMMHLIVYKISF